MPGLAARAALALLRAYKYLLSPWFTGACRFVPTCGDYAAEAIARHGLIYGTWLAARRLARCQPFGSHGHDPVPRLRSAAFQQASAWQARLSSAVFQRASARQATSRRPTSPASPK